MYSIKVINGSGNWRPYFARVYREDGTYVGQTGQCKSPGRARDAARALIDADSAVVST